MDPNRTGDEVRMPLPAVIRHAGTVDRAADGMELGRSAATRVQLDHAAYGLLCSFLPGLLDPVAEAVTSALAAGTASLRQSAADLRTAASRSESTDRFAARRVVHAAPQIRLPL